MTHTYNLTGMTCSSCESKVKTALFSLPDITEVEPSKDNNSVAITMNKHVGLSELQSVLGEKYQISAIHHNEIVEETKSWFHTYKPVLIIFGYLSIVTIGIQISKNQFDFMEWMRHFMAGFFLTFSFFKILNLKDFAESYAMYDIVAKRFLSWGYIYVFTELALGLAFLTNYNPKLTNWITLIVMSVSIIGVLQSVLNKKKIQCACLGAVFNLPMSTITIIEDALMIGMSVIMLLMT
jgi:copper chaperone CopZ